MEFSSVHDILKFTLTKEEAAVQFYQDLSTQAKEPSARSLFEIMVKNEQKHVEVVRLEIMKLGYTVDTSSEDKDTTYQWEERLEMDEDARKMGFLEALELAIQKERAAFRLYTQILGMNKDPQFEKILMELAEEEMRHVIQFEREYESITHPKD